MGVRGGVRLAKKLGVGEIAIDTKYNATTHGDSRDYYGAETRDIVRSMYAKDINLYESLS